MIGNGLNTQAQEGYHVFTCGTPNSTTTENSRRVAPNQSSSTGMNYYDCDCLSPIPSFTITSGNTIYLECEHPGTYVPVFLDASATQYENAYEVRVEDINTGNAFSKMFYGPASTINLQTIFPNMQVNNTYLITLKAINTCDQASTDQFVTIEYNPSCGGWFLRSNPNPANEILTIEYNLPVEKETDTEISIVEFNNPANLKTLKSKGKQIKGKHSLQINTNALKSGTYLVVLKTPEKILNHKVQIIH